jgi:hypothetical protein
MGFCRCIPGIIQEDIKTRRLPVAEMKSEEGAASYFSERNLGSHKLPTPQIFNLNVEPGSRSTNITTSILSLVDKQRRQDGSQAGC